MPRKRKPSAGLPSKPIEQAAQPKNGVQTPLVQQQSWSGPVPPPAALRGYEDVLEGSANRIITMAESEMAHSHKVQAQGLTWSIVSQLAGQACAFAIALFGLWCSYQLGLAGKEWAAVVVGGGSLATIVLGFLKSKSQ